MFHMTRKQVFVALLVLGLTTIGLGAAGVFTTTGPLRLALGCCDPVTDRLVVHEWGTFTSFSGSDGVKLEFRPLEDTDLPYFVLDRQRQSGLGYPSKFDYRVLQRMETPVTYFYVGRPREVNVRVGFPSGLLTEFYPPVASMKPAFKLSGPEPVANSELDWGKVWLIPEDHVRSPLPTSPATETLHKRMVEKLLPSSDGFDHYAHARKTDSALVYSELPGDPKNPLVPRGGHFEKFLFYRGIGNFDLPLKLTAPANDKLELTNSGPEPITNLFLVTVDEFHVRFTSYARIAPGEKLTLDTPTTDATVDQLAAAVKAALVREKLYDKEAAAMVETWRKSWFGETGTRLFYMLPQAQTDKLLPLSIEPAPQELVRVMVGRMEIMRPSDEARITEQVRRSAEALAAEAKRKNTDYKDPADAAAAAAKAPPPIDQTKLPNEIAAWGRLAEPALVRVRHVSKDPMVQQEAYRLLSVLRAK